MSTTDRQAPPRKLGRYILLDEIAAGGMATVHVGRLLGPAGFTRTVAIKRLHPQFAKSPEFVGMLFDEARLAARIRHPHVISTLDVVARGGELFLVMEYVQGETFARLLRTCAERDIRVPPRVTATIVTQALLGLHAAHEATNEQGEPLQLVHRDVSPQNILVGIDGASRVLDFGIAKARSRLQTTEGDLLKGKLSYMSPEQLLKRPVDRRADVFAMGVVLWQALTVRRLFNGDDTGAVIADILSGEIAAPSSLMPDVPAAVDRVVLKALAREPRQRFPSARDMARALSNAIPTCDAFAITEWLESVAGDTLKQRAERIGQLEQLEAPNEASPAALEVLLSSADSGTMRVADDLGSGSHAPITPQLSYERSTAPTVADLLPGRRDAQREPREPRERRRKVALAAGLVLGASALLAVSFSLSREAKPELGSMAPAAAALAIGAVPQRAESPAAAVPSSSPEPTPAAVAAPASSAPAAPAKAAVRRAGGARPSAVRAPTKTRANCDPPYILSPNGIRRYKRECF